MFNINAIASLGETLINKLWPDPNKRAIELRKLKELEQQGDIAALNAHVQLMVGQLELNKQEAAHKSLFVAGWRPAVGWVCALGLFWAFLLQPIGQWVVAWAGVQVVVPVVQLDYLFELLVGMLGMGGLRTFEKLKQVAREK